jgi:hypothetical protein
MSYISNTIKLVLRSFARMNWILKLVTLFLIVNLVDQIQMLDLKHHALEKILMLLKQMFLLSFNFTINIILNLYKMS